MECDNNKIQTILRKAALGNEVHSDRLSSSGDGANDECSGSRIGGLEVDTSRGKRGVGGRKLMRQSFVAALVADSGC